MGEAIGQVLSFGVAVAISPIPIIGVVLMLATPQGKTNGLSFITGWVLGLAGAGTIVLLASSGAGASESGQPADWVSTLKLILGTLLLLVALRQWRGRPAPNEEAEMPSWMATIDQFSAAKAAGFGVALAAINPKNLLMVIGAAAAIAQTGASTGSQAVALIVFVLIGTLGTGAPLVIYFAMGDRAGQVLSDLKAWLSGSNAAIMAVLCLVIGAKLIGDGLSSLSM